MTPERQSRFNELLERATDLPSAERAAFLLVECGGDIGLRRALDAILKTEFQESPLEPAMRGPLSTAVVGRKMLRYRIAEKIGEGGMGEVFRAEDTELGRSVALKFLSPVHVKNPQTRERFLREARAAGALDHPNICTVFEIGECEGYLFIAMPFLEGQTLSERIEKGLVPVEEAIRIALQTARGLEAAHAKGIVHRDIKPANLMLAKTEGLQSLVKIMDFGVARMAGYESLTVAGSTPGTAAYMAPEQIDASPLDHRIDIWALGVVLYEMVAGYRPFGVGNPVTLARAIVEDVPDPLADGRVDVPPMLDAVVSKALAKRPEDRYQSAAEMAAELEAVGQRYAAEEPPAPRGEGAPTKRPGAVIGAIVAALAILAILVWLFFAGGAA